MPTLQEFASICNELQSVSEVAERLGMKPKRVIARASEARKAGFKVHYFWQKTRTRLNGPGDKFGRLTAIGQEFYSRDAGRSSPWLVCKCECGAIGVYSRQSLRKGTTASCGCLRIEQIKEMGTRHGRSATRLYGIWSMMKQRCFNRKVKYYAYYGGRGIVVCQEWVESFPVFAEWAALSGYQDGLEIDRKDADGNYCPDNCRWATRSQQMFNTRKRNDAESSRYKGVFWCNKSQRWVVRITTNSHVRHVGHFRNEIDAARAYAEAAKIEHGEFARTNFTEPEA